MHMKMNASTAIAAALILTLSACNARDNASGNEPAAAEAAAGDALNGTWKVDLASLKFEGKPDEYLLQGGTYKCNTCIPPLTVAADGEFHAVADRPYYDSIAIKTVDDHTIEIRRRKGDRDVSSATQTVSADGNVLTTKFKDSTTPNAPPIEGSGTARRSGPAPAGAHAVSGQWTEDRIGDYSAEALNITYQINGNTVTSSSQGQSYTAQIGGPAVPIQGDIGGTTVAVAREGATGLRETYTRDGKEVSIVTIMPSADGHSFNLTNSDPRNGSKVNLTANKAS
jgi:hypothetical protein